MRLIVMLLSFTLSTLVCAGELPVPAGKVLLTLSGNIENTNGDGKAVFDVASLEKLGMVSFQTTSPWYDGRTTFTGVPLQKLMDYVGAKGSVVKVTALNDYTTEIGNDSNLLIVFYVQIIPDDFVMQLHRF